MTSTYIGASLKDMNKASQMATRLEELGHTITFKWWESISHEPKDWPALSEKMLDGLRSADTVILLLPGGRGMHVELGAALITASDDSHVILVGEPTSEIAFYNDANVRRFLTMGAALRFLKGETE